MNPLVANYETMVLAGTDIQATQEVRNGFEIRPFDFNFWDANGAIHFQPTANTHLRIDGLWINNDNTYATINNRRERIVIQEFTLSNRGLNVQWDQNWGHWQGKTFVSYSAYEKLLNGLRLSNTTVVPTDPELNADRGNRLNTLRMQSRWKRLKVLFRSSCDLPLDHAGDAGFAPVISATMRQIVFFCKNQSLLNLSLCG